MKKVARSIDPFTINVVLSLFTVCLVLYAWKAKSKSAYILVAVFGVFSSARWIKMNDAQPVLYNEAGYNGSGLFYNDQTEGPNVVQSGISMVANVVEFTDRPDEYYVVENGTNAYIDKDGNVKTYSPISSLINGWQDKENVDFQMMADE